MPSSLPLPRPGRTLCAFLPQMHQNALFFSSHFLVVFFVGLCVVVADVAAAVVVVVLVIGVYQKAKVRGRRDALE